MTDPSRPGLRARLALLAGWVVVGSALLWWSRADELTGGLPCEARGWLGCAVDGPLYFAVGLLAGGTVWVATTAVAMLLRRSGGRAAVAVLAGTAVWTVLFALLLVGTRSV